MQETEVISANITAEEKKKLQQMIDSGEAANISHAVRRTIDAYPVKAK